ncbi:uncharacterized protein LOC110975810 isoform X2 [Acanthaster planci]|uniref:Uncharacterized protein LOC110975810 isoform X2 n=1 Tax=Acanthaster planci TaxID=133434 RepID=A0A8B7XWV9_ACAPL|nr:uncharacterized protein LOC110975810 isoform X2 [Acanthaster planci]
MNKQSKWSTCKTRQKEVQLSIMGGPSNKINKPKKPGFRIIQRQKRNQVKANPPTSKKTFSGGMSKWRPSKGVTKKRKINVSTNSSPSGKKLRKLLRARLRSEKEASAMQELTSLPRKQSNKSDKSKAKNPSTQAKDNKGEGDIEMQEV